MATIQLTEEQRQTLRDDRGEPIEVLDPATQEYYVLLPRGQYERVRCILEQAPPPATPQVAPGIPPGILRAQQAFWRELPDLLSRKKWRGSWVLYHLDRRVGVNRDAEVLIRDCIRRSLPDDECYLAAIVANDGAPWEVEEVPPFGHEVSAEGPAPDPAPVAGG